MFDKKKILGKASKLLKTAQQEGGTVINASRPFAKKTLRKISEGAIHLGNKGKKIAEDFSATSQDPQEK